MSSRELKLEANDAMVHPLFELLSGEIKDIRRVNFPGDATSFVLLSLNIRLATIRADKLTRSARVYGSDLGLAR